jgi:hypothetical protein
MSSYRNMLQLWHGFRHLNEILRSWQSLSLRIGRRTRKSSPSLVSMSHFSSRWLCTVFSRWQNQKQSRNLFVLWDHWIEMYMTNVTQLGTVDINRGLPTSPELQNMLPNGGNYNLERPWDPPKCARMLCRCWILKLYMCAVYSWRSIYYGPMGLFYYRVSMMYIYYLLMLIQHLLP